MIAADAGGIKGSGWRRPQDRLRCTQPLQANAVVADRRVRAWESLLRGIPPMRRVQSATGSVTGEQRLTHLLAACFRGSAMSDATSQELLDLTQRLLESIAN